MSDEDDAARMDAMLSELCDAVEKKFGTGEIDHITITCPWCHGSGHDGFDRCCPPNSYVCQICEGSGRVEIIPFKE